jgi:hypothetical protein
MKRVEFHNTEWLDNLRDRLTKKRFGDWGIQSIDLYQCFLKLANPTDYEQLKE